MKHPDGFTPLFRTSPVLDMIGPLVCKGTGKDLVLGLMAEDRHCNGRGYIHGGILATLADTALGYTIAFSSDPPTPIVTVNLNLDYTGSAKVGDWLEASVDIHKHGTRLIFASCVITAAGAQVVRANAVFLVTAQPTTGNRSTPPAAT
ncbi:MAG: PaaI family thioesterase [Dokdonella sp.]